MTEPVGAEWLDQQVRITRDAIYFGEHKLPGIIADGGVEFRPGGGRDINKLTVTFYVGELLADDPLPPPDKSFGFDGMKYADGTKADR